MVEVDVDASKLKDNEIHYQILAAAINPADLSAARGTYGTAQAPSFAGMEGVGKVLKVGKNVKDIKVGDHILPGMNGTWREEAIIDANVVIPVSKSVPVEFATTMANTASSALRMLSDFEDLKAGDVVVQNGANSAVGQAVIQIAKARGIKTINIVRSHGEDNYTETVDHLKGLGGDIVCTAEYVNTSAFKQLISDMPSPKLGLDCVGGKASTDVARALGKNATLVSYGMGSGVAQVAPGDLIFKQLKVKPFWMGGFIQNASKEELAKNFQEVASLAESNQLNTWVERFDFNDFENAIKYHQQRKSNRKVVLKM